MRSWPLPGGGASGELPKRSQTFHQTSNSSVACFNAAISDASTRLLFPFHDCRSIRLEPIAPGYSGADTFIVKATLIDSNAGPEPVPYFAKLGRSDKMQAEWQAFRTYAEHHVQWYLRPNFVPERTTYGVNRGILVGTCPLWM